MGREAYSLKSMPWTWREPSGTGTDGFRTAFAAPLGAEAPATGGLGAMGTHELGAAGPMSWPAACVQSVLPGVLVQVAAEIRIERPRTAHIHDARSRKSSLLACSKRNDAGTDLEAGSQHQQASAAALALARLRDGIVLRAANNGLDGGGRVGGAALICIPSGRSGAGGDGARCLRRWLCGAGLGQRIWI